MTLVAMLVQKPEQREQEHVHRTVSYLVRPKLAVPTDLGTQVIPQPRLVWNVILNMEVRCSEFENTLK